MFLHFVTFSKTAVAQKGILFLILILPTELRALKDFFSLFRKFSLRILSYLLKYGIDIAELRIASY